MEMLKSKHLNKVSLFVIIYTFCYKMPKTTILLSEDVDRQLKHYMADYNITDKRIAIQTILEKQLKK